MQYINIDSHTRRVIGRWMFELNISSPVVSYQYSIKAPIGEMSNAKFYYINETATDNLYRFTTSHPNIMKLPEGYVNLKSGDKAQITAVLKVMTKPTQAKVLVFVEQKGTRKCDEIGRAHV